MARQIKSAKKDKPLKISRSRIWYFMECPRCFYLDIKEGIKRPGFPPFTLNNAVDALLKKEFDIHRAGKTAHPLMEKYGIDAIPFEHEEMDVWRSNFKGLQFLHEPTGFIISGAVDDIWVNKEGELIVVDYKATSVAHEISLEDEWKMSYKKQMEIYQWILRRMGFKVSDTGYFVFANGRKDRKAFDGKLEFEVTLLPHKGDDSWVEGKILEIKKCLDGKDIPEPSPKCGYCRYCEERAGLGV